MNYTFKINHQNTVQDNYDSGINLISVDSSGKSSIKELTGGDVIYTRDPFERYQNIYFLPAPSG